MDQFFMDDFEDFSMGDHWQENAMDLKEELMMEESIANGGASMNVTFVLVLAVICLQIYTSDWFQNIDLNDCKILWNDMRSSLSKIEGFAMNPARRLEIDVEMLMKESNWTNWQY